MNMAWVTLIWNGLRYTFRMLQRDLSPKLSRESYMENIEGDL